jgi:outer membrane protein TolC
MLPLTAFGVLSSVRFHLSWVEQVGAWTDRLGRLFLLGLTWLYFVVSVGCQIPSQQRTDTIRADDSPRLWSVQESSSMDLPPPLNGQATTDSNQPRTEPISNGWQARELDSGWAYNPAEVPATIRQWRSIDEIESQALLGRVSPTLVPVMLDITGVVARTLQHSKKHKQLEIQPSISRQQINKEYGFFDPSAFVRSQFDVQNLQQKRENNQVSAGVRKNHLYGGSIELNESLGVQDNIVGFNLPDQGTAAVNVIYTQELLRDGGKDFVLSKGLIASYQFDQQFAVSLSESSNLIQKTITAYWQLYRARANYFLQLALVDLAYKLMLQIEDRSNHVERSLNSLEQARALHFEAQAELVDAQTKVLQAQDNLYRLINDPSMDPNLTELLTMEGPVLSQPAYEIMGELSAAIQSRPEIKERLAAIRQNAVDLQVSLNQLLPKLSVSLRSSLNGFQDNRDYFGATTNYGQQPASATAGANLEVLMFNRTAKARNKEAQLKSSRLYLEFEDQLQGIREEVLVALRVVNNASPKIELRSQTLRSREREIDAITSKIWINPEEGASVVVQLEQLFQAINRLIRTQQQLIDAKVELQTSVVALQRAKGELVSQSLIPVNQDASIPRPRQAFGIERENRPVYRAESRERVQREPMPEYGNR